MLNSRFQGPEYQDLATNLGNDIIQGDGQEYEDMLNQANLFDLFEQLQELHSGRVSHVGALLGILDALVDNHVDIYLKHGYQENDYD